jgi:hypothetical protein
MAALGQLDAPIHGGEYLIISNTAEYPPTHQHSNRTRGQGKVPTLFKQSHQTSASYSHNCSLTRMWLRTLILLGIVLQTRALHFYIQTNEERCFLEELPSDTIVEGELFSSSLTLFENGR